jgi:hypothetical protein
MFLEERRMLFYWWTTCVKSQKNEEKKTIGVVRKLRNFSFEHVSNGAEVLIDDHKRHAQTMPPSQLTSPEREKGMRSDSAHISRVQEQHFLASTIHLIRTPSNRPSQT